MLDPFGGSSPVPGAVITYTVTMTLAGSGTITGAQIDDAIPANTTYVADSLTLDTASPRRSPTPRTPTPVASPAARSR